jgi:hypothetical protein
MQGKEVKKLYAEDVLLTEAEHEKLIKSLGAEGAEWCIRKLSAYKGSTGKTYVSDYKAILSWVIGTFKKDQLPQGGTYKKTAFHDFKQRDIREKDIEHLYIDLNQE